MSTEMAHVVHTSDSEWDNRTPGIWYGELVIERPNGETDYVYAYSNVEEYAPDLSLILPEGCKELEAKLLLTSHGKWELRHDRWSFDEQMSPHAEDIQSWDAYWDANCRAE